MDLETFVKNVENSLSDAQEGPLSAETDFKALTVWDSLAVLTVTDTIDMEYGVLLKKQDYQSCATLRELFELMLSKR